MGDTIVKVEDALVSFGKTIVHNKVSFSLESSEVTTILGPSGSGKTVLLKLIIGLLQPNSGRVEVCGNEMSSLNETELREARRDVGMLFQGAALFDSMSVRENIAYPLRERGENSESLIDDVANKNLELVGLPGYAHRYPSELSGGQKKRVGLARALASNPKVILFDEPTTGLDPTTVRLIDDLIIRLRDEEGITSIVVTHDIASAKSISDRWILIANGGIQANGSAKELASSNQEVIEFIEGRWRGEL